MRDGYNPFYVPTPAPHVGKPRITFSRTEVNHLAGAVGLLTLCFAVVLGYDNPALTWYRLHLGTYAFIGFDPYVLLGALMAVSTGFVLHELAHKVVAQRYGHWAEFRAQFSNMFLSLAMAVGLGFFFAAPGAVMIQGAVTRRENGLISIVGPGVNFVIALLAWPFTIVTDQGAPLPLVMHTVAYVNAGLCVFNLLPFGPLDGRKVLAWSKLGFTVFLVLALALLVGVFFTWNFAT